MHDKWKAKDGVTLDPKYNWDETSDITAGINHLRPTNKYSLNLTYENAKVYTGILANWYTGQNEKAFSAKRFLVLDWNLNYQVSKEATLYLVVTNLTNEAYETSADYWSGKGSAAMPGRAIMGGVRYQF